MVSSQDEDAAVISHKDFEGLIVHDVAVPVRPVRIVTWVEAYIEVVLTWFDEVGLTQDLQLVTLHPSTYSLACTLMDFI